MKHLIPTPGDGLIIIVNYNQAQEIGAFLTEVALYSKIENCIVVDDGSTDGSDQIAEKNGFQVIRHSENLGVGAAIRTGLNFAFVKGVKWVLISASNGKMRPEEFSRVYGPVSRHEADYVQGNRFFQSNSSPGLPLFRRLSIPLFSLFASLLMGRWFSDITCGLRCYTLDLLKDQEINLKQGWLDHYELEYYLHFKVARSKKYRMLDVPVTMRYSQLAQGRTSKIQPFIGWWSMIRPFILLALHIRK